MSLRLLLVLLVGASAQKNNTVDTSDSSCACAISVNNADKWNEDLDKINGNKLFKYIRFHFQDENGDDVIQGNKQTLYNPSEWVYVDSRQGNSMLSLPFNFDVLSITTLSFQVTDVPHKVTQNPPGCLALSSDECIKEIISNHIHALLEFRKDGATMPPAACSHKLDPKGPKTAIVAYDCKFLNATGNSYWEEPYTDPWLNTLHGLILMAKLFLVLFGPLMISMRKLAAASPDEQAYRVPQEEPMKKTMYITSNRHCKIKHKVKFAAKALETFKKFRQKVEEMPKETKFDIVVPYLSIQVPTTKTQTKDFVNVGFLHMMKYWLCTCGVRFMPAYVECCEASVLGRYNPLFRIRWFMIAKVIGALMFCAILPTPYYIRVMIYYMYEHDEVTARMNFLEAHGYWPAPTMTILHFFSPASGLLIAVYIIFAISAIALGAMNSQGGHRVQVVFRRSLERLARVNYFYVIGGLIRWILWPLTRFGVLGLVIGILYWPICIVFCIIVFFFYCIPLIHLTVALVVESVTLIKERIEHTRHGQARQGQRMTNAAKRMHKNLKQLHDNKRRQDDDDDEDDSEVLDNGGLVVLNIILAFICVLMLWAFIILFAECAAYFIETLVYLFIGIIVNSASLMKYVTIIFLLFLYANDTASSVFKSYGALNGLLFGTILGRIDGLQDFTRLRFEEQHNQGFKSKNAEENDYVVRNKTQSKELRWMINNLILFVDRRDKPRIPQKLFFQIAELEVDGVPGPIHYAWVRAILKLVRLLMFLMFVIVVVFAFSELYSASPTTQVLATMAGGFFPFFFKSVIKKFDVNSFEFTNMFKYKLDEELIHFSQDWPMHDFYFELPPPPPEPPSTHASISSSFRSLDETVGTNVEKGMNQGAGEAGGTSNDTTVEQVKGEADKEVEEWARKAINGHEVNDNDVIEQVGEKEEDKGVDYLVILSSKKVRRKRGTEMEVLYA